MIFDSIKNKKNYKNNPRLYEILSYLSTLSPENIPQPGTVIEAGTSFCNPVTLKSKPKSECMYEAHRDYIDLHYILKGTEGIATADVSGLTERIPYDPSKDIGFYSGEESTMSYLNSGDFMVCYPSDAHMVAVMKNQPEDITKIVVKIKAEEG